MIEHIEYFKTTDGKEFKSAEEALTHELEINCRKTENLPCRWNCY